MRRLIWMLTVLFGLTAGIHPRESEAKMRVVATLSTFADLVQTIGGDRVDVHTVASPRFNPHFIEPKPSDVLKVKRADLFVHAGLDLELWRWPLVDAAGKAELRPGGSRELDLSKGIVLLEVPPPSVTRAAGDIHIYGNPHYWMDPSNAKIMARAIAEKLLSLDPGGAHDYQKNLADFAARLDQKIPEWKEMMKPFRDRELAGYHNEWPYFVQFVEMKMDLFLEPKPGVPPTPRHVEFVEQQMKERGIRAIVQATYFPKEASIALAKRTGSQVALLCHNVKELPEAKDYVSMMDYNVRKLAEILKGS